MAPAFPCPPLHPPDQGHIVAEVCDRDHEDLLTRLGNSHMLFTVVPRDISALMMVQCARHPQVGRREGSECKSAQVGRRGGRQETLDRRAT